jgi:hypothetical protein
MDFYILTKEVRGQIRILDYSLENPQVEFLFWSDILPVDFQG